MEENKKITEDEQVHPESLEDFLEKLTAGKQPLEAAEKLISLGYLEKAQTVLNQVKENSAWKYYLQSRIYESKCWYNEQRKMLKKAVKAEPDNELYKSELQELEEFSKTPEYKSAVRKQQMGDAGSVCAECGTECCCMCICEGICEGLGNGC